MKPALVIIGLGNPGKSYENTRHNTGFAAVDFLEQHFGTGPWKDRPRFRAHVAEGRIRTSPILLMKPQTYMNLSGETVQKVVRFFALRPTDQVLILCDDVDLPCGTVRFREKGSAGTHNGLKSIVEQIGEEFPRMRIGIGPKPEGIDLALWVLHALSKEEQGKIAAAIQKIPAILQEYVTDDVPSPRGRGRERSTPVFGKPRMTRSEPWSRMLTRQLPPSSDTSPPKRSPAYPGGTRTL